MFTPKHSNQRSTASAHRTSGRWASVAVAAALLGLAGCSGSGSGSSPESVTPPAPPAPGVSKGLFLDETLEVGSERRVFDYYAPNAIPETNAPVVILLHGGGQNKAAMRDANNPHSLWLDIADASGFLVVIPNGADRGGNTSAQDANWNDCRNDDQSAPSTDDVAYIDSLITWAAAEYNADTSRVYVTGSSNGGLMAYRAALELGSKVAAFAAFIANMPANSDCAPLNQPVPAFILVGSDDPLMPYNGGQVADNVGAGSRGTVMSAQATRDFWTSYNAASAPQATVVFDDIDTSDNTTVSSTLHVGVSDVQYLEVANGGHVPPGIAIQIGDGVEMLIGNQNHDIEALQNAWDFLRTHTAN